jgi:hypothetical protein
MTARALAEALRGLVAGLPRCHCGEPSALMYRVVRTFTEWDTYMVCSAEHAPRKGTLTGELTWTPAMQEAVRTLADYDRAEAERAQCDELSTVETILLSRKGTK